jgi:hypothetical protein
MKASSIHKAQGISVGPTESIKRCVVGVSAGGKSMTPGLDLVGFSRATEQGALALWNDLKFSKKDLLAIGRGKGYDSKREFEAKLRVLQVEAVPPMVETIAALSEEKTFEGGYQFLIRWFRKFTSTTTLPFSSDPMQACGKFLMTPTPLPSYPIHQSCDKFTTPVSSKNKNKTTASTDSDILDVYEKTVRNNMLPFQGSTFSSVCDIPFGTVINVPADGNCGYHVLRLGLNDLGILPRNFRSISRMRKSIRDFSITTMETLQALLPAMVNSDFENFLQKVYDEKFGNFDRVVPHFYWMTMDYLPFVILLQFNLKYVVIFADVASDPRTYIYERKEGPLELKFWNEKGFHFPGEAHHNANSIFMIWENESHFKYIKIYR